MDYELGFKLLVGIILGWFGYDKKQTATAIKELQDKTNSHSTDVAVMQEQLKSVKEDTRYIRKKLDN